MPKTTILWGAAPELGDEAKTYEFATQAELDAFLQGVEEMDGWMGYDFKPEGYVHSNDEHEVLIYAMTSDGEGGLRLAQRDEDVIEYDVAARVTRENGDIDELEEFEFPADQYQAAAAKATELANKYHCDWEDCP